MIIYALDKDFLTLKKIDENLKGKKNLTLCCFTDSSLLKEAMKALPPDLLLLDADAKNSLAVIMHLSSDYKNTKIVIMSNFEKTAIYATQNNLFGFIKKPITKKTLDEYLLRFHRPTLAKIWKGIKK